MLTFAVQTHEHSQMLDITGQVQQALDRSGLQQGAAIVYVPHTTAALTINENADPDVTHDILHDLDRLVPWEQDAYRHDEGNSAAHAKAAMVGHSVTVLVDQGRLRLGRWQGVFFCEFDGPRHREVHVQFLPTA